MWVALHPSARTKNGNKRTDELLEPLLKRAEAASATGCSRPITSQSPALPTPAPQLGLPDDAIVLATLSKMIEHQAVIVQTIQRMEKEMEQTRQHQLMLSSILESLSEPNTPAMSGESANASV